MAGHVDISQVIPADLDTTWRITNDPAHLRAGHSDTTILRSDPERNAITLRIVATSREGGKSWQYHVERIQDPTHKLVYAHRWGSLDFTYSHAVWHYDALADGQTRVRCIQDFEVSGHSKLSDSEMERIIDDATKKALSRTAELVAV